LDSEDRELVAAARNGDRSAFGLLYLRYRRMVHAVVLGIVSYDEADDVVQEVFLTVMRKLSGLREIDSFGAWLGTIARNLARAKSPPIVEMPQNDLVEPRQESDEEAHRVLVVLRALPEAYRETLTMRLVEGMTGPEIAAQTGLTHDSVRVNLHRGMQKLREALHKR
jgi:RNA polymerase sigma-70 factor (ECF subfamily)